MQPSSWMPGVDRAHMRVGEAGQEQAAGEVDDGPTPEPTAAIRPSWTSTPPG
jgi:hypothetical protein